LKDKKKLSSQAQEVCLDESQVATFAVKKGLLKCLKVFDHDVVTAEHAAPDRRKPAGGCDGFGAGCPRISRHGRSTMSDPDSFFKSWTPFHPVMANAAFGHSSKRKSRTNAGLYR
jgi:hypothetical protein